MIDETENLEPAGEKMLVSLRGLDYVFLPGSGLHLHLTIEEIQHLRCELREYLAM